MISLPTKCNKLLQNNSLHPALGILLVKETIPFFDDLLILSLVILVTKKTLNHRLMTISFIKKQTID
ncbi:hypothetical protein BML2496_13870 [Providencia rettgeri]|nr:hypothetical protein BML2496_13870 [Providencia rettgeri]